MLLAFIFVLWFMGENAVWATLGFWLLYFEWPLGENVADESPRASPSPAVCSARTGTLAAVRQGGMQGSGEATTKRPVGSFHSSVRWRRHCRLLIPHS